MISGSLRSHRRRRIRIFRRKLSASFYLGAWIPPVKLFSEIYNPRPHKAKVGANVSVLLQFHFVSSYARTHARTHARK